MVAAAGVAQGMNLKDMLVCTCAALAFTNHTWDFVACLDFLAVSSSSPVPCFEHLLGLAGPCIPELYAYSSQFMLAVVNPIRQRQGKQSRAYVLVKRDI